MPAGPILRSLAVTVLATLAAGPVLAQDQGAALPPTAPLPALQWVRAANGAAPLGAISGGAEGGRDLFVCRARLDAELRVGTLRMGGGCEVPMGAEGTATRPSYEVLTGPPWMVVWKQSAQTQREDIVVGGRMQGRPVALCQIDHFAGVHSGMVVGDRCMVAAGGKTVMADSFRFGAANPGGAVTMRWASGGWAPQGALTAAGDPNSPTICLAEQDGAWWPGHLRGGLCATAGGQAAPTYQTVVADPDRVLWSTFTEDRPTTLPLDMAAIGGHNPGGDPVTICRAEVAGRLLPGHVSDGRRCVVVTPDGETARLDRYDVLLYRQGPPQTAGR